MKEDDVISDRVLTIKHVEHPLGEWFWEGVLFKAIKNQDGYYYWTRDKPVTVLSRGLFPSLILVNNVKEIAYRMRVPYKPKLSIIRKSKPGSCMYFRDLNEAETLEFQQYAETHDPDMEKWDIYHPVCRAIWEQRGFKKNG